MTRRPRSRLTLIGLGHNTHMPSVMRVVGSEPVDVLLTNVSYEDDARMRAVLAEKRALYPEGTRFHTSMHEIGRFITNFEGRTLVVDSLNLWLSNVMLVNNSDRRSARAFITEMQADVEHFMQLSRAGVLGVEELIVLGSEVDFDFHVPTDMGQLYQEISYLIMSRIAQGADRYGIAVNGEFMWTSPF